MTDNFENLAGDPLAGLNNPLDGLDFNATGAAMTGDFIRVITSGGSSDVPIDPSHEVNGVPGYSVAEILSLAGIYTQAGSVFWVNNSNVGQDFVMTSGQSLTVIGPAKGG